MVKSDIIVIGASAGGIEATHSLLKLLPSKLPASIFIVIHISPQLPSHLAAVLSRGAEIKVINPSDGDSIEPGMVYVAPSNRHLLIKPGTIRLGNGPRENRSRPSIDALFRTAAFAYQERVLGIILSGALNDGTAGMMTIKSHGGTTIVQDPNEASFSSMPKSAMDFVEVDYVLPIADIAKKIVELVNVSAPQPQHHVHTKHETFAAEAYQYGTAGLKTGMPGTGVPLTCPECGGTLWQSEVSGFKEFKCHVGHSFTTELLLQEQADAIDAKFWKNLRQLEENVWLRRKLAEWAASLGKDAEAKIQESLAEVAEQQAEHIRRALITDINKLDTSASS